MLLQKLLDFCLTEDNLSFPSDSVLELLFCILNFKVCYILCIADDYFFLAIYWVDLDFLVQHFEHILVEWC